MRGNAPLGAGATAGVEYDQDRQRHIQALGGAGQLAQLDLQNQSTGSQEYQAGSPGRLADIAVNNQMAAGRQGQVGDLLSTQENTIKSGAIKADTERIKSELAKLNEFADEWAQADSSSKETIKEKMADMGIKIGTRSMREIPTEKLDQLMKVNREARVNTPTQVGKEQVEKIKGQNQVNKATIQGEYSLDRQSMVNEGKAKADQIRIQIKKEELAGRKETKSQWEAAQLRDMAAGTMTELQKEVWMHYQAKELEEARAKAANAGPQLNLPNSKILTPPTTPKPQTIPGPTQPAVSVPGVMQPPKGAIQKPVVDTKTWKAIVDGKEENIIAKGEGTDEGTYQLEDGRIIDKDGKVVGKV
jgi:hypothetical protein